MTNTNKEINTNITENIAELVELHLERNQLVNDFFSESDKFIKKMKEKKA